MRKGIVRLLPFFTTLVMAIGLASCAGKTQADGDGPGESSVAAETGEHAEASTEGSGEHDGGREAAESREEGSGEHAEVREPAKSGEEGEGEHGGEEGEGGHDQGGEEGEEPGVYIARADTWDMTRKGARLVLAFDPARRAFIGRVVNTTERKLCAVRVEVHLSGGSELGPTPRTDVPAGGTVDVELSSEGRSFETWTAHPELSQCP